ncbi:peptide deformylase [Peptostreptococcaceae bacterium pGA-8]|nr:peptide deformylase [Peptostreptococcaceae bacterium pGA-8]
MALRNVVVEGDDILRKKCREVGVVTNRIRETLQDMVETMRAEMGVGIAAPQVGIMRRMFIAEPEPEKLYYMIDPVIISQEGSQTGDEGCLSVPGMIGTVTRPEKVIIEATDLEGNRKTYEFQGFDARVMCHENDHLNGVLYTDIATNIRPAPEPDELDEDFID